MRAADGQRKRPEREQSCRRTSSRMLAQDVLRPFFADLVDSIINHARWKGPAGLLVRLMLQKSGKSRIM